MLIGRSTCTRRKIKVKFANLSQLTVFNLANLALVRLPTENILLVVPRDGARVNGLGPIPKRDRSWPIRASVDFVAFVLLFVVGANDQQGLSWFSCSNDGGQSKLR